MFPRTQYNLILRMYKYFTPAVECCFSSFLCDIDLVLELALPVLTAFSTYPFLSQKLLSVLTRRLAYISNFGKRRQILVDFTFLYGFGYKIFLACSV